MDMLMPSVASYLKVRVEWRCDDQTTPLCSTQRVLKALGEDTEDGLMEIDEVVSLLHEELIAMSATLREVTSQDKAESCSLHSVLQHFAIPLKDRQHTARGAPARALRKRPHPTVFDGAGGDGDAVG